MEDKGGWGVVVCWCVWGEEEVKEEEQGGAQSSWTTILITDLGRKEAPGRSSGALPYMDMMDGTRGMERERVRKRERKAVYRMHHRKLL